MRVKILSAVLVSLIASIALAGSIYRDSAAGGWVGTALSNLTMGSFYISFGTDPADAGAMRLDNAMSVCWEADPTGTDACMTIGTAEELTVSAKRIVLDLNAANPQEIAWGSGQNTRIYGDTTTMTLQAGSGATLALSSGKVDVAASNPGDTGQLNFDNGEGICWEKATPGTDGCMVLDSNDALRLTGIGDGVNAVINVISSNSTKLQFTDGGSAISGNDISGITMTPGSGLPVQIVSGGFYVINSTTANAPAAPATCNSTYFGAIILVDDSNDGAVTFFCYCGRTADDATYDWLKMDGTACPSF